MEIKLEKRGHRATLKSNFYKKDYWVSLASWKKLDYTTFGMKTETFSRKRDCDTFVRKISNLLQSNGYEIVNNFN